MAAGWRSSSALVHIHAGGATAGVATGPDRAGRTIPQIRVLREVLADFSGKEIRLARDPPSATGKPIERRCAGMLVTASAMSGSVALARTNGVPAAKTGSSHAVQVLGGASPWRDNRRRLETQSEQ